MRSKKSKVKSYVCGREPSCGNFFRRAFTGKPFCDYVPEVEVSVIQEGDSCHHQRKIKEYNVATLGNFTSSKDPVFLSRKPETYKTR